MNNHVTIYHGTSAEAMDYIKQEGFKTFTNSSNWYVSGDYVYFNTKTSEDEDCGYTLSAESALIAAASDLSDEDYIGIIEMNIPENIFIENFESDSSCENMGPTAVRCKVEKINELLTELDVIYHKEYIYDKVLSPWILFCINNNSYINEEKPGVIASKYASDNHLTSFFDIESSFEDVCELSRLLGFSDISENDFDEFFGDEGTGEINSNFVNRLGECIYFYSLDHDELIDAGIELTYNLEHAPCDIEEEVEYYQKVLEKLD